MEAGQWEKLRRNMRNVESGINLLLSSSGIIPGDTILAMDLFGGGGDSVLLFRKTWGLLEVGGCSISGSGTEIGKHAMIGSSFTEDTATAVCLADLDRPLFLCGRTILTGDCIIPRMGFQRVYIEGKSFTEPRFCNGRTIPASRDIPGLDEEKIQYVHSLMQSGEGDTIVDLLPDTLRRDFLHSGIVYHSPGVVLLGEGAYKGNIRITSSKEIRVLKSASLDQVLLIAPRIVIEDGFSGTIQAYATDTLIVGKEVSLEFPSVLGILRSKTSPDVICLEIGRDSKVQGMILGWEQKYDPRKLVRISIEPKACISGYVYCSGTVDHKGVIYGKLIAKRFLLKTPSGIYENHLLDAEINRGRLSSAYGGPDIFKSAGERRILRWL